MTNTLLIILSIILMDSCTGKVEQKEINPNSKPYRKLTISQEDLELKKMANLKVSSRTAFSKFSIKYAKSGGREILVEKVNFDNTGNKSEEYRYQSNGDVDIQWLYNYDYYNRPTSIESYDGFQKLIHKETYQYNSDGYKVSTEIWGEKERNRSITEYNYDNQYNLKKEIIRSSKKELLNSVQYSFSNNLLDTLKIRDNRDELLQSIALEYDSTGRLVGEKQIDKSGKVMFSKYIYDDQGNITEIRNSVLSSWEYQYDANGNILVEIQKNSAGFLQSKFVYKYNSANGLIEEKIRYDGEDDPALTVRYEYEYNK